MRGWLQDLLRSICSTSSAIFEPHSDSSTGCINYCILLLFLQDSLRQLLHLRHNHTHTAGAACENLLRMPRKAGAR